MKIRHLVISLLPALAVAEEATTVPDDEPLLPPLPEELLSPPQRGKAELPATAQPVVAYRAPEDDEQTWLKLHLVKPTEDWPEIFRRLAEASHAKDMQMCHGFALWLQGKDVAYLRYDDDLSLSGIYADGHAYGVLYVEFSPYGVRACPMEGFDLSGQKGGVCWQESATRLWSWAEAEQFWAELPKLLRADKQKRATSAQHTAVRREVASKGQRMVVFWATPGYQASAWWPSYLRLHAHVGSQRFSLVAHKGLNLWTDVTVPVVAPPSQKAASTQPAAVAGPAPATPPASAPKVKVKDVAAPAVTPATPPVTAPAVTPPPAPPQTTTAPAATAAPASTPAPQQNKTAGKQPSLPDELHPATGTPGDTAPHASVRPWAMENSTPAPSARRSSTQPATNPAAATTTTPASTPTTPATSPTRPASTPAAPAAPVAAPAEPTATPAAPAATPAAPAAPTLRDLNAILP